MDEIMSGHSSQVLAWLEARGVSDAVALYAIDEASRCHLGAECPDACGALDDYAVTYDIDAGTRTARANSGRPALDAWTVFASSGEHSYAALSATRALTVHAEKSLHDFVQALVNDAFPASVTSAHLTGTEKRTGRGSGRLVLDTWTVLSFSGEYSYAAADAVLAVALHRLKHPSGSIQVVINDAYPASVIIANLIANQ
jgi:hypothetical protein